MWAPRYGFHSVSRETYPDLVNGDAFPERRADPGSDLSVWYRCTQCLRYTNVSRETRSYQPMLFAIVRDLCP
jgi:hypothetical protein